MIIRNVLQSKKALEMSFSFIFAMIVGAVILFLAIYGVTNLIKTSDVAHGSEVSKEISIITNPLQTSIETSREMAIDLPQDTRIKDKCYPYEDPYGQFGAQGLKSAVMGVNNKYGADGVEVSVTNKYLFTPDIMEGKKLYLFSKGFDFPFKIGDIIIATSSNYCFVLPPSGIGDEISSIKGQGGMQNIEINDSKEECANNSISVCFGAEQCDVNVEGLCTGCQNEYDMGLVEKNNQKVYFTGNLIYGAIFADKDIYECNVQRLMKRLNYQGVLFLYQTDIIAKQNCITGDGMDINAFAEAAGKLNSSLDLLTLRDMANNLNIKNSQDKECALW